MLYNIYIGDTWNQRENVSPGYQEQKAEVLNDFF